jgi:Family of unknown function (DUF5906)
MNNEQHTNVVKQPIDARTIKVPSLKIDKTPPDPEVTKDDPVTINTSYEANLTNPEGFQLLTVLWGSSDLFHQIGIFDRKSKKFRNIPVKNVNEALSQAKNIDNHSDSYFACGEYKSSSNRKADNVAGARAFWMDFDCGAEKESDGKGYLTKENAEQALNQFCDKFALPKPNYIVDSGNGLHMYWAMSGLVKRTVWQVAASKLKALTTADNLKVDDSRTADIASVLRIPGTFNNKNETPKPVKLVGTIFKLIEPEAMLKAIDDAQKTLVPQKPTGSNSVSKAISLKSDVPELDRLKSALKSLDPDCDEATWKLRRLAPMAKAATDHPELSDQLLELAREWSSGDLAGKPSVAWSTPGKSGGLTGEAAFEIEWNRFSKSNYTGQGTTVNTIYYDAMEGGWKAPNEEFTTVSDNLTQADDDTPLDALQTTQKQYGLVNISGKLHMFDKRRLEAVAGQPAQKLELSNRHDASLFIERSVAASFPNSDAYKISKEFFKSPATSCYSGVYFHPKGNNKNYLNLWVGPYRKAKKGHWKLIDIFLKNVICDGDEDSYNYLINYIAHALQLPEKKPGVMLILMGGQGIGKGTLGRIFQKIWTSTYLQVSNIDAVTGSFNAALERSFIVFMDEALFSGDRKSSDALKSLVTEPLIHINEKYQPARQTQSFHRFIAATNATHFKNTENDDRRDFVLKVSDRHKDDHSYWNELDHEMNHGGIEAFMYDLLEIDLTGFNVRAKPSTAGLLEQKLLSLGPIEGWWYDSLDMGAFESVDENGRTVVSNGWLPFLGTTDIINDVMHFVGNKIYRKPSPRNVINTLTMMCPSITKEQKQTGMDRCRGLSLPKLHVARAEFETYIGGKLSWLRFNG